MVVGVCGGFEDDDLEPCGHTFSNMQKYDSTTAQNDCIEMVEMIRKVTQIEQPCFGEYEERIYDKIECRERSYTILKYSAEIKKYDQGHIKK